MPKIDPEALAKLIDDRIDEKIKAVKSEPPAKKKKEEKKSFGESLKDLLLGTDDEESGE